MSEFNKKVGHKIPKAEAEKQMKNWKRSGMKTQSSFFGSDVLNSLLQKDNVIGIRINYGLDEDGNMAPVLTPEFDSNAVSKSSIEAAAADDFVNASFPCPPYCPK